MADDAPEKSLSAIADECLGVLTNFPDDGQLRDVDQGVLIDLLLAGFVERKEVHAPCKLCGKPRYDYGYFRVTGGGKLFVEMAQRVARP